MAGAGMQHGDSGRRAWRENDLTTSLDAQSARGSGRRARPVLGRGRAGGRAGGRARRRPGRPVRPATGLSPSESPADRHAVASRGAGVRVSVPCARTVRSGRRPGLQGEWTVLIPPQNGEKHGELCEPRGRSPSRQARRTPRPPPTSPRPRARPRRAGLL